MKYKVRRVFEREGVWKELEFATAEERDAWRSRNCCLVGEDWCTYMTNDQVEFFEEEEPKVREYCFRLDYMDGSMHCHAIVAEDEIAAYQDLFKWANGYIINPAGEALKRIELTGVEER